MPYRGTTTGAGYASGRVGASVTILDRIYTVAQGGTKDTPKLRTIGFGRMLVQLIQANGVNTGFAEVFCVQGSSAQPDRLLQTVLISSLGQPELFEVPLACRQVWLRLHGPAIAASGWTVNLHLTGTS